LHGINATILRSQSVVSLIGLIRRRGARPVTEDDVSLVSALMPHLQRAVQLHSRIAELEARRHTAEDALDRWSLGVFLLDRSGAVLMMNRAAEELVRRGEGLAVDRGGLRALRADESARLRKLIRSATLARTRPALESGGVLSISRSQSERPLHLLV